MKYELDGEEFETQEEYIEALSKNPLLKNSYAPWTKDDDLKLLELSKTMSNKDLAIHLKRKIGSINSRLAKLEDPSFVYTSPNQENNKDKFDPLTGEIFDDNESYKNYLIDASLISEVIFEIDWNILVGSKITNNAESTLDIISIEHVSDSLPRLNVIVDGKGKEKTYAASAFMNGGGFKSIHTHRDGAEEIKRLLDARNSLNEHKFLSVKDRLLGCQAKLEQIYQNCLRRFLLQKKRFDKLSKFKSLYDDFNHLLHSDPATSITSFLISREVKDSGVEYLIHATLLENLESILKIGLVTRGDGRSSVVDDQRLDGRLDHISASLVSVGKYIYAKKYDLGHDISNWCILRLDTRLLWQRKSLFFPSNAAKSEFQSRSYRSDDIFHSADAYRKMWFGAPARIDKEYPQRTKDVQAEIQIPGNIPVEFIKSICLHPKTTTEKQEYVKSLVNKYASHINTVKNRVDFEMPTTDAN